MGSQRVATRLSNLASHEYTLLCKKTDKQQRREPYSTSHDNLEKNLKKNRYVYIVERFYEDLQGLLELTPKSDVLFITGDWNAKVGGQETPGVTGLGMWNEARQRLLEFCQENALVIANTLFQQHKRRLYTWTSPDGQHLNQID